MDYNILIDDSTRDFILNNLEISYTIEGISDTFKANTMKMGNSEYTVYMISNKDWDRYTAFPKEYGKSITLHSPILGYSRGSYNYFSYSLLHFYWQFKETKKVA